MISDTLRNNIKQREKKHNHIYIITSAMLGMMFLIALINLLKLNKQYEISKDGYKEVSQMVFVEDTKEETLNEPSETTEDIKNPPFIYDEDKLKSINTEAVGFLYVPALDIKLPIAYGSDNSFYLNHNIYGNYDLAGCLFLDARTEKGIDDNNIIIYGHNMSNGSMFGTLKKFLNSNFFGTDDDLLIYIYTGNEERVYKIFSTYITNAFSDTYTYYFPTNKDFMKYKEKMLSQANYNTNTEIGNAQMITLSTCSGLHSLNRTIIQAERVK